MLRFSFLNRKNWSFPFFFSRFLPQLVYINISVDPSCLDQFWDKTIMCSSMELLPNHVVELILQRLPVKPLSRFKSVSKTWKSTIESQRFQQEQLSRRMQSQDPDVLFVPFEDFDYPRTRVELGSSIVTTINKIPLSCYSQGHGTYMPIRCSTKIHFY